MKIEIEQKLQALIGLQVWSGGRAATMAIFQFGNRNMTLDYRGDLSEVGDYALHLQCVWRLTAPDRIVTGTTDYFVAAEAPCRELADFEWSKPGLSKFDHAIADFFETHKDKVLIVEAVWADSLGSFRLSLSDGYSIEGFPDTSMPGEHWRLFVPQETTEHFVVTGAGIGAG